MISRELLETKSRVEKSLSLSKNKYYPKKSLDNIIFHLQEKSHKSRHKQMDSLANRKYQNRIKEYLETIEQEGKFDEVFQIKLLKEYLERMFNYMSNYYGFSYLSQLTFFLHIGLGLVLDIVWYFSLDIGNYFYCTAFLAIWRLIKLQIRKSQKRLIGPFY